MSRSLLKPPGLESPPPDASKRVRTGVIIFGKRPKVFDYAVPEALQPLFARGIPLGQRVLVPFRNRVRLGLLVDPTAEGATLNLKLLDLLLIVDDEPIISQRLLSFMLNFSRLWAFPLERLFDKALLSALKPIGALGERSLLWCLKKREQQREWQRFSIKALKAQSLTADAPLKSFGASRLTLLPPLERHIDVHDGELRQAAVIGLWEFRRKIYTEKILEAKKNEESVLFLFPDLKSLQARVKEFSFEEIEIYHANLSVERRLAIWEKAARAQFSLIFGLSQAFWLPFKEKIHLILDQEESEAYRDLREPGLHLRNVILEQSEQGPHPFLQTLFGSSAPSLELIDQIKKKNITTIFSEEVPKKSLINVKKISRAHLTSTGDFSEPLLRHMTHQLRAGKEVVILSSHKGSAYKLYCAQCQDFLRCPRCNTVCMAEIGAPEALCGRCRASTLYPEQCPLCHNPWVYMGIGSQQIAQKLSERFTPEQLCVGEESIVQLLAERRSKPKSALGQLILLSNREQAYLADLKPATILCLGIDLAVHSAIPEVELKWMHFCVNLRLQAEQFGAQTELIFLTHYPNHPLISRLCQGDLWLCADHLLAQRRQHQQPPYFLWVGIFFQPRKATERTLLALKRALLQIPRRSEEALIFLGPIKKMLDRRSRICAMGLIFGSESKVSLRFTLDQAIQWCKTHAPHEAFTLEWDPKV